MGSRLESITFFLALVGYTGLTVTTVMASCGRLPNALWRATAGIIVLHVLLVWHVRYEWQLAEATRHGYAGFLLFHGALAAILAATFSPFRAARALVTAAFFVVSLGAIAATSKYEVVSGYRVPVLVLAAFGLGVLCYGVGRGLIKRRSP